MPREVKLGALVGDRYRVEEGLAAGERVATGAQFLLDSESRLRASSMPAGHVH
jgi:Cu(I)/Ag(I) efflux system membrane fusion protein